MSTVQEEARERAAQELAKRVAAIAAITDPLKWARRFVNEMTTPNTRGRWSYVPADPGIKQGAPKDPAAYDRGGALARDLLNIRKDEPHA